MYANLCYLIYNKYNMKRHIILIIIVTIGLPFFSVAQEHLFSLEDCINYALENSTDINRAQNNSEIQSVYLNQSKAARLPNLKLNASQQFSSTNNYDPSNDTWNRDGNSTFLASLSSQVNLYNGAKLKNTIKQNEINFNAAQMDIQTEQEYLSLVVLSAYIDVLLSKDNVRNSKLQLEATQKQLAYAQARKDAGAISLSDLLNIKSELATNKTSLIEAESNRRIMFVALMQLMNMPVRSDFDIQHPPLNQLLAENIETNPVTVYEVALNIQPSIKNAELKIESSEKGIKIAKADVLPSLDLNGVINTVYGSSINGVNFGEQISNGVNPYAGLSLSVPIFKNKETKTQIILAQIQVRNSELELMEMKNNLRKYIEQACTDAQTAQSNYNALQEQLKAENESYQVNNEMFTQGMINSVDLLSSKNNFIVAENKFTQAKYNLLLQNKIVEYYQGNPISF